MSTICSAGQRRRVEEVNEAVVPPRVQPPASYITGCFIQYSQEGSMAGALTGVGGEGEWGILHSASCLSTIERQTGSIHKKIQHSVRRMMLKHCTSVTQFLYATFFVGISFPQK